jgi:hypothetical protein
MILSGIASSDEQKDEYDNRIFHFDDDEYYPGFTEAHKEFLEITAIAARSALSIAETEVNLRLLKKKKEGEG